MLLDTHIYWNTLPMHGPINVKSPNNTSKWQMGFNLALKGLILVSYLCVFVPPFLFVYIRNYPNECCKACLCVIIFKRF
jgi:hypothetical protein